MEDATTLIVLTICFLLIPAGFILGNRPKK